MSKTWIEAFKKLGIDYCTVFDNTAKLKLRQYINSLAFRNFPVTELFWSQRKALEKIKEGKDVVSGLSQIILQPQKDIDEVELAKYIDFAENLYEKHHKPCKTQQNEPQAIIPCRLWR